MSELSRITESPASLWHNNPVFTQLLGLSPVLAVSTSVVLGFALGVLTVLVFFFSAILIFYIQHLINDSWRFYIYLIVLATITTIAEIVLQIFWYQLYRDLGIYLPLICCNVILLMQLNKQDTFDSLSRLVSTSSRTMGGFFIAILLLASLRELIGNGSLFDKWQLLIPASSEILPNETGGELLDFALLQPGALLIMGLLLAGINWFNLAYGKAEEAQPVKPAKRARVTGKI